jgi:membrane-bound lytic murein transglycosylase A
MKNLGSLFKIIIGIVLGACPSLGFAAEPSLRRLSPQEIPSLRIDDSADGSLNAGSKELFRAALLRQIPQCKRLPSSFLIAGKRVARERWCEGTARWFLKELASGKSLNDVFQRARSELEWYQSAGKPDTHEVQFTGYYFPVHRARLSADSVYRFPIYSVPQDLKKPYFTRAQIESGILKGKGLEIGYFDNPVDPYILEVQGSGAIVVDDGLGGSRRIIVNYANENGRPYTSLGKLMRASGVPEEYINLQGIKKYFTEIHPEDWNSYSNQNESYVFFRKSNSGPFGSSGAILTPKHSIAIDEKVFPLGLIGVIRTERPDLIEGDQAITWKSFSQFVITQDTGGAIRSPGRVDVFWGEDPYSEVAAGRTDRTGELYFALVPAKKKSAITKN